MLKPEMFYQIPLSIFVLPSFDTKKYTIKISLTNTVFSFARSVDALQNTCIFSKQKEKITVFLIILVESSIF